MALHNAPIRFAEGRTDERMRKVEGNTARRNSKRKEEVSSRARKMEATSKQLKKMPSDIYINVNQGRKKEKKG